MKPRVRLLTLWERESAQGRRYFAGYWGNLGIVMFRDDRADLRPGCLGVWEIFAEERDDDRRPAAAAAAEARRPAVKRSKPYSGPDSDLPHGRTRKRAGTRQKPSGRNHDGDRRAAATPLDDPVDDIGAPVKGAEEG